MNYWQATLYLNDEPFGQVQFGDEKSRDDFFKTYEELPKDQKWGFALFEFEEE